MKGGRHETHNDNFRSLNSHDYTGNGFRWSGDNGNKSFGYRLPGIRHSHYRLPTDTWIGLVLLHTQDYFGKTAKETAPVTGR